MSIVFLQADVVRKARYYESIFSRQGCFLVLLSPSFTCKRQLTSWKTETFFCASPQTTNDAHDTTQEQLAATNAELAAARNDLATTRAQAEEAITSGKKHEEALKAVRAELAVAEKKAADALASVHVARQAEERAKKEAAEAEGKAKAELAAALSEVELAKKANATLESRWAMSYCVFERY